MRSLGFFLVGNYISPHVVDPKRLSSLCGIKRTCDVYLLVRTQKMTKILLFALEISGKLGRMLYRIVRGRGIIPFVWWWPQFPGETISSHCGYMINLEDP